MWKPIVVLALVIGAVSPVSRAAADPARVLLAAPAAEAAVRETALLAAERAAERLGRPGGFFLTPEFHIAPTPALRDQVNTLTSLYSTEYVIATERALNRAAETSARAAARYLSEQLPALNVARPAAMLAGPADAITAEVHRRWQAGLAAALMPVLREALKSQHADEAFRRMTERYEQMTHAPFGSFDLDAYAVSEVTRQFFACMADEEARIRTFPSARPTPTLQKAFAGNR